MLKRWWRETLALWQQGQGKQRVTEGIEFATNSGPCTEATCSSGNMGGGMLDMQQAMGLPPKAFECHEWGEEVDHPHRSSKAFVFSRRAKGSIMLRTEMGPKERGDTAVMLETADVYLKASDEQAQTTFMAVIIGIGVLDLARAVSHCGFIPGACLIISLATIYSFLCHRLIEVPHLLRQNIETYGGIAKVCFNTAGWRIVVFLVVSNWFGVCTVYLMNIILDVASLRKQLGMAPITDTLKKIVCGLLLVPCIFLTSPKDLRRFSVVSLYCIGCMAAIEMVCAVWNGVSRWGTGLPTYHLWGENIGLGIQDLVPSFDGIGILPYIVSEMLHPEHANKMVTKACGKQTVFYLAVGMVSYFGWGDEIKEERPLEKVMKMGNNSWGFRFAGMACTFFGLGRAVVTFSLYFWPLCREIDRYLSPDQRLAVELGLPWAIKQAQRQKWILRLGLLFLMVVATLLNDSKHWKAFVASVPLNLVQFCVPSVFAVTAVFAHRRLLEQDGEAAAGSAVDQGLHAGASLRASNKVQYFWGSVDVHTCATCLVALLACLLSFFIFGEYVADR